MIKTRIEALKNEKKRQIKSSPIEPCKPIFGENRELRRQHWRPT